MEDTKQTPRADGFRGFVIAAGILEDQAKPLIRKEFRPTVPTLLFVSCLVSKTGLLGLWTLFIDCPRVLTRKRLI